MKDKPLGDLLLETLDLKKLIKEYFKLQKKLNSHNKKYGTDFTIDQFSNLPDETLETLGLSKDAREIWGD